MPGSPRSIRFFPFRFVSLLRRQQQRTQVGLGSLCWAMLMPVVYALLHTIGGQSSAVFPVLPCMDFDVNAPCLYFIFLIICKTMDGLLSSDCYMCHLYRCDELDCAVDMIRELVIHVWIFFMVPLY